MARDATLDANLAVDAGTDAVTFRFSVTNAGSEPVELSFRDGQTFDVVIRESGAEAWRWSEGRMFTQALQSRTLDPGEAFSAEATWESPSPGEYEAVSELTARDVDCEARASFDV